MKKLFPLFLFILLGACQVKPTPVETSPTQPPPSPTPSPSPTQTATTTITFTPIPTTTSHPTFSICCPLEDETIQSLPLIITNPLKIPSTFGQDTGHHGVDFAYYQRGKRMSIEGIEIFAIMNGDVIFSLNDDIPYGFALLIETSLSDLPESIQHQLMEGYQPVPEDPHYRLFCPEVAPPILTGEYSVYHLYAHMQNKPPFSRGDTIQCGQALGTVGNTGYSSNPHLHLEVRIGPAGANFKTMAHYENTNTTEQMGNYCLWRMSGYYQLFDPFILFDAMEPLNP